MRKSLLIIDSACRAVYDSGTLIHPSYSGTSRTVTAVAESLGRHLRVFVLQRFRKDISYGENEVIYAPLDYFGRIRGVLATILLRKGDLLPAILDYYPKAAHFIWCHDYPMPKIVTNFAYMERAGLKIIAVSAYHKRKIEELFQRNNLPVRNISFDFVYNPIPDDLNPDNTPYDSKKLFFASAVTKGMGYALEVFQEFSQKFPDFHLYLANPSFSVMPLRGKAGQVHFLGGITHDEVLGHMRDSLCLFYPNYVLPETFGLVLAEANAVGTPVLTHDLGAAREVLRGSGQIIDVTDKEMLFERLISWSAGKRPQVFPNEACRLSAVTRRWLELL